MSDKESSSSNNSFEFKSNDNNNDELNNILVTTPKVLHPTLSSISSDHHLNLLLQVTNSLYKSLVFLITFSSSKSVIARYLLNNLVICFSNCCSFLSVFSYII